MTEPPLVQPVPSADYPDETDRLVFEATRLLTFVKEIADEFEVDLPEQEILTIGEAVHDCPALMVAIATLNAGMPDATPTGIGQFSPGLPPTWTVTLICDIVRCAPKMTTQGTVSPKNQAAMAAEASADAAVLWHAVLRRLNDHFGFASANISFLEPEGSGYAVRLTVNLAVH